MFDVFVAADPTLALALALPLAVLKLGDAIYCIDREWGEEDEVGIEQIKQLRLRTEAEEIENGEGNSPSQPSRGGARR
jgi:hypothetical protein